MRLTITIIENNNAERETLRSLLRDWAAAADITLSLFSYASGEAYFAAAPDPSACQLFILDIQLDGMSGLAVAQKLRQQGYKENILFLTAFREYVFDGYGVHALNYLLKPVTLAKLAPSLSEVLESAASGNYVFHTNGSCVQIPYRDILVFAVRRHYVDITTGSGDTYCQVANLKDILPTLPQEFLQCHRSFIVNMAHIRCINRATITLSNKLTVPVGPTFLEQTRTGFSDYLLRFHEGPPTAPARAEQDKRTANSARDQNRI